MHEREPQLAGDHSTSGFPAGDQRPAHQPSHRHSQVGLSLMLLCVSSFFPDLLLPPLIVTQIKIAKSIK